MFSQRSIVHYNLINIMFSFMVTFGYGDFVQYLRPILNRSVYIELGINMTKLFPIHLFLVRKRHTFRSQTLNFLPGAIFSIFGPKVPLITIFSFKFNHHRNSTIMNKLVKLINVINKFKVYNIQQWASNLICFIESQEGRGGRGGCYWTTNNDKYYRIK